MPKSRKRKISNRKKRRRQKKGEHNYKPYEPVKYSLFSMPDIFGDTPIEERREIIRKLGEKAKDDFSETYNKLGEWFKDYDAPYLLSFCSVYFLSAPEGVDREAIDEKLDFYQHDLELLQAISLTQRRSYSPKTLPAEETQRLLDSTKSLKDSIFFRQFYSEKPLTNEELKKRGAIAEIRGQTTAVRNAFYPQQTFQLARKLYSKISDVISENYNLEVEKILDFLWKLMDATGEKLNTHLSKVRSFIHPRNNSIEETWELYKLAFPSEENDKEMFSAFSELVKGNEQNFKYLLASYTDLRLPDVFSFSLDELASLYGDVLKRAEIGALLDLWSYSFGDLESHNIEHFILDNPILRRPFIRLNEETYFCPAIGVINHSLLDLMEILVTQTKQEANIKKYEKIRGNLLEDEVEQLFREYFSNAQIFKGSLWNDISNNKNGENDLLVLLDTFALVIECKAGKVNDSARRGSILKLRKVLKDLVVEASEQANNFINFLSNNTAIHQLPTKSAQINQFDNTNIRYYVPLTITLESLGSVSANLRSCVEVGWIDAPLEKLAPSIPLGDLEIIFEILENEIERTHYLIRRSQIEKSLSYRGDELDLLAFYLDTGFNFGADENKTPFINFTIKSKELDPYFVAKARGKVVAKPKLNLSTWWRDIIITICKRKPKHWVEMGYVLLNVSKKAQKDFKNGFHQLIKRIRQKQVEHPINFATMITEPENRSYAIAVYPYTETDKQERDNTLRRIIEEVDTDYSVLGIVSFGISMVNPNYPYNVSAYFPKELLGKSNYKAIEDVT